MVLKELSRKTPNFAQLVSYISGKELLKNKDGTPFIFTHNLPSQAKTEIIEAFKNNDANRTVKRKDGVRLIHTIISWHALDNDKLDAEAITKIAQKYVALRNENALYWGSAHTDKKDAGLHLHLAVSSAEEYTGKAISMSKRNFANMKRELQEYEISELGLNKSAVAHGKGLEKISDREYQLKERTGRLSHKDEVRAKIESSFNDALSRSEFYQNVEDQGFSLYERAGRIYGVDDGCRHRFSTLGFDEEKLKTLDEREERLEEIEAFRHMGVNRELEFHDEEKQEEKDGEGRQRDEQMER